MFLELQIRTQPHLGCCLAAATAATSVIFMHLCTNSNTPYTSRHTCHVMSCHVMSSNDCPKRCRESLSQIAWQSSSHAPYQEKKCFDVCGNRSWHRGKYTRLPRMSDMQREDFMTYAVHTSFQGSTSQVESITMQPMSGLARKLVRQLTEHWHISARSQRVQLLIWEELQTPQA
jgi:hypothetical protein